MTRFPGGSTLLLNFLLLRAYSQDQTADLTSTDSRVSVSCCTIGSWVSRSSTPCLSAELTIAAPRGTFAALPLSALNDRVRLSVPGHIADVTLDDAGTNIFDSNDVRCTCRTGDYPSCDLELSGRMESGFDVFATDAPGFGFNETYWRYARGATTAADASWFALHYDVSKVYAFTVDFLSSSALTVSPSIAVTASPSNQFEVLSSGAYCVPLGANKGDLCRPLVSAPYEIVPLAASCVGADGSGILNSSCGFACASILCASDPACVGMTERSDGRFRPKSRVEGFTSSTSYRNCWIKKSITDKYTLLGNKDKCDSVYNLCQSSDSGSLPVAPRSATCATADGIDGSHNASCGYHCVSALCDADPACAGFDTSTWYGSLGQFTLKSDISGSSSATSRACFQRKDTNLAPTSVAPTSTAPTVPAPTDSTLVPSVQPTRSPTRAPTLSATDVPSSLVPTSFPTRAPIPLRTEHPWPCPSLSPTRLPTASPLATMMTLIPSRRPTLLLSSAPASRPSSSTARPTASPITALTTMTPSLKSVAPPAPSGTPANSTSSDMLDIACSYFAGGSTGNPLDDLLSSYGLRVSVFTLALPLVRSVSASWLASSMHGFSPTLLFSIALENASVFVMLSWLTFDCRGNTVFLGCMVLLSHVAGAVLCVLSETRDHRVRWLLLGMCSFGCPITLYTRLYGASRRLAGLAIARSVFLCVLEILAGLGRTTTSVALLLVIELLGSVGASLFTVHSYRSARAHKMRIRHLTNVDHGIELGRLNGAVMLDKLVDAGTCGIGGERVHLIALRRRIEHVISTLPFGTLIISTNPDLFAALESCNHSIRFCKLSSLLCTTNPRLSTTTYVRATDTRIILVNLGVSAERELWLSVRNGTD